MTYEKRSLVYPPYSPVGVILNLISLVARSYMFMWQSIPADTQIGRVLQNTILSTESTWVPKSDPTSPVCKWE